MSLFLSMLNVIWYQKGQYISLLYTVDYLLFWEFIVPACYHEKLPFISKT